MNCRRRVVPVLLCAVLLLSLCGCLSTSMDSLYGLPQISKQYLHLEELAETEISGGSEYSAPTLGAYRQSIQFYDMNGDGADEALAFFRDSAGPYIIIYTERAGGYAAAAKITGEGSAIGAVEYSDLDGDGFTELIVEWQQGGGLRLLCVYSLKDWAVNQLYTAPSSGFKVMDLLGDGGSELLILVSGEGGYALTEARFTPGKDPQVSNDPLSNPNNVDSVDRLRAGTLADGVPALFVEGKTRDSQYFTDIFVLRGGRICNLTRDPETGVSLTLRGCPIYSTDINGDRSLEVPLCVSLPQEDADTPACWLYDWYGYRADGSSALLATTYHCTVDGWYLTIPQSLRNILRIRRDDSSSGEHRVVLSVVRADGILDVAVIYTLTGENRSDRAAFPGRFVLKDSGSVIYAAQFLISPANAPAGLTEADLRANFALIVNEWNTGAL